MPGANEYEFRTIDQRVLFHVVFACTSAPHERAVDAWIVGPGGKITPPARVGERRPNGAQKKTAHPKVGRLKFAVGRLLVIAQ